MQARTPRGCSAGCEATFLPFYAQCKPLIARVLTTAHVKQVGASCHPTTALNTPRIRSSGAHLIGRFM